MKKIVALMLCVIILMGSGVAALMFKDEYWHLLFPPTNPSISDNPIVLPNKPTGNGNSGTSSGLEMVALSLPINVEVTTAEDGTILFRRIFQDVDLSIADSEITRIITLDLLQRMDVNSDTLLDIESAAIDQYSPGDEWDPYYYQLLYSPTRIDSNVLSLYGSEITYDGYENQVGTSVNYDLLTGKIMTVADLLEDPEISSDDLCNALITELDQKAIEVNLYSDYADTIRRRFQADIQMDTGWYFSATGLHFFYAPYDIAPNSAGIVDVCIPYDGLVGIIKDEYLNPEMAEDAKGDLEVSWFDDAALEDFNLFCEAILDPDAPAALLFTQGALYDLTIEAGQWINETQTFLPSTVVFASSAMSAGEGVVLNTLLKEYPTLRISYVSDYELHRCYIVLDPSSTDVLLIEESK